MPQPYIVCPRCGWTSHNRNDVAQRYCGHCHVFHDDLRQPALFPGECVCRTVGCGHVASLHTPECQVCQRNCWS